MFRALPPVIEFQSTPPAEARGDLAPALTSTWVTEFQSTPPAEARGDARLGFPDQVGVVSIHSPRRSEGRLSQPEPS